MTQLRSMSDESRRIALQLYSVRRELQSDPLRTLRRIAEMGFRAVETAPLPDGLTGAALTRGLSEAGLEIVAIHVEMPGSDAWDVDSLCQSIRPSRPCPLIWHGWPKHEAYSSLAGIRGLVARCHEIYRRLSDQGIGFGLHNHWWEFEPVSGVYPYRILHEELHPDIGFEVDTYWAQTAGVNPATILRELGSRVRLLHVKDGPAVSGLPMTAVGDGSMNFEFLREEPSANLPWIIELDECETDRLIAVERSLTYLKALRFTKS